MICQAVTDVSESDGGDADTTTKNECLAVIKKDSCKVKVSGQAGFENWMTQVSEWLGPVLGPI